MDAATEDGLRSRVIVGTPEQVADAIRAYAPTLGERGLVRLPGPLSGPRPERPARGFDVLVEEVVPLLRG